MPPEKKAAPRKGIQVIARAASVLRALENDRRACLGQIACHGFVSFDGAANC